MSVKIKSIEPGSLAAEYGIQATQFSPQKPVTVILPDVILNHEGPTLDGKSMDDIRRHPGTPIILMDLLWETWQSLD